MSENKKIAKNTIFLFARMLLVTCISLYTSRIILNALGVSDFGLYNVIGGVVSMMTFINGSAASATSRFLTYDLGQRNLKKYQTDFSAAFVIHLTIAVLILIVAETIGLWFVNTQMTIPDERIGAANFVYQMTILSIFFSFTQVPYNASLIAHEDMNAFAYVSVFESFLKLGIAILMSYNIGLDKLKLYSLLLLCSTLLVTCIYRYICVRSYKECRLIIVKGWNNYNGLINYSGWDIVGALSGLGRGHGINILLNIFFGTFINAARAIAYQVDAAVNSFTNSFMTAIQPQIVKTYASNEKDRYLKLLNYGACYSMLIFSILALPLILESNYVLKLWLKEPPEYASVFVKLVLIDNCVNIINKIIGMAVHATGNVKALNIYAGTLSIMQLPCAYILFKLGMPVVSVFLLLIIFSMLCIKANLNVLSKYVDYSQIEFMKIGILRALLLMLPGVLISLFVQSCMEEGFLRMVTIFIVIDVLLCVVTLNFGISKESRRVLYAKLNSIKNKYL